MEFISSLFPQTVLGWVVQVVGSIVISSIIASFSEYIVHRHIMHQGLPKWIYKTFPVFEKFIHDHEVLHHTKYYRQFDYEPDTKGRNISMTTSFRNILFVEVLYIPILVLVTISISIVPTVIFVVLGFFYTVCMNMLHSEIHQPRHPFWSRWGIYKFFGRVHYLHHQDTRTGFNFFLPYFDYIFKTLPTPTEKDKTKMRALGF